MKITLKSVASLLAVVALFTYSSCDKNSNPQPTIEEQQLAKLTATWRSSDVTLDGVSKRTDYSNFQIVLSGTAGADQFGYSTTGRPKTSPWPDAGNWSFGANAESQIIRDPSSVADKLDMGYTISADGGTLQITFSFSGTGYQSARTGNVKGNWIFTFTK